MLKKALIAAMIFTTLPTFGAEVSGSDKASVKACVKSLIETELKKNDMDGVLISEVSIPTFGHRYSFVGAGENGIRYSGQILIDLESSDSKTACRVSDAIVVDHNLCKLGCWITTFELSAQIFRYSGDRSRNTLN